LITDRINAAVASLGADKTVKLFNDDASNKDGKEYTRPNIEVRVGAILALERIARMNDSVHIQIMEILCAYVRENTKHEFKRASKDRPDRSEPFYRQIPRNDLQLAIRVIGRRSKRQIDIEYSIRFRLDFANCDLSGFHFSKGNFCGAIFENCVLEASEFRDVKLNGARFTDSYLGYVNFLGSDLTGCNLNHTKMKKTQLNWAKTFYGALIAGADLSGSDFPGTPEETNTIFETKDTKTSIWNFPNFEQSETRLLYSRFYTKRATQEEIEKLSQTGFMYWSPYDAPDLATSHYIKNFWERMGLLNFPYTD